MIGDKLDPRKTFGAAIDELAEKDDRIVVMSADSGGSSGHKAFMKNHPDRYFECGIMEQGVTGIASGLATTGKIPIFCAIAPFVTCRNYEMARNDLGYMRQNVKLVGRNSGFTYSDLGATHHSLEDFAIMRMIPGMVVLAPQDPTEIRSAAKAMVEHVGPVYMRIGNPAMEVLFEDSEFVIGKGRVLQSGDDLTIVSTGTTTVDAIKAADMLKSKGVNVTLVGMPTVWPLDKELLVECAKRTGRVMVVEEHYVYGGLGGAVAELLSEECPVPVKRHGVPHVYAISGPYADLLAYYKLDAKGIAETALEFLGK